MEDCAFCNGEVIEAEFVGEGLKTAGMSLQFLGAMFGREPEKQTRCHNSIQLQEGNKLAFDNSCGEYAILSVEIKYCPFCGKILRD